MLLPNLKKILIKPFLISFFIIILSNIAFANVEEINKINKQLESIESLFKANAMDEEEYDKIKSRLLIKKKKLENKKKVSKNNNSETSITLRKQLEVLEKLLKDGVLSQEEFEKTKQFLKNKEESGENIDLEDYVSTQDNTPLSYEFIYPKDPGRKNWEKTEIIYKNFKILPYRPGGIKIVRASDNKKLFHIVDNFKHKYFNGGEKFITFEKSVYDVGTGLNITDELERGKEDIKNTFKDISRVLGGGLFKEKKRVTWDKEAHRLKLYIDGTRILNFEGRYVKKHRAFFYQVLTPRSEGFHYYIKIKGKKAIALNMEIFNVKIDKAIRKAKKKLSEEYDVTEDQIQKIIDKRIEEEVDKSVDDIVEREMEKAINESVAEAIEDSIGQAMSQGIMDAIEQATGEAIDQAMEDELANHIDQEIERAIQDGLEEAAVAAGFQAYYDTLLSGGSIEDALRNAGEACGEGCEFVLDE